MNSPNSVKRANNNPLLEYLKTTSGSAAILKVGDLVQGKILEKGSNRIIVDLGQYGTGVVYRGDIQNAREIVKNLKPGDALSAKVVAVDNEEGMIELSIAEADKQKNWLEVMELKEKEEILTVRATKFNRGGFIVEINGLPAFLPISQLAGEHFAKISSADKSNITALMEEMLKEDFRVKIIDVNSRTNKLIVSERAAMEVSLKELAKNYTVGQVIEGIVSGIADFGVFVRFTDNPAVEGMIHLSELDWREVINPKEVVSVDQVLKAKIVDIKDGKIFLSLKALTTNPWERVDELFKVEQEARGKVYALNPFGAIINLDHGLQGQVHITEFGDIEEMKKSLSLGKEYNFVIKNIDKAARRIILKLKK
jgi:ribosomal protein S1